MVNLILIDDHDLFRLTFKALIKQTPQLNLIADYSEPETFFDHNIENTADIIIVDLLLEDCTGLEIGAEIRQVSPDIKLVLLTMDKSHQVIEKAEKEGFNGVIYKDASRNSIIQHLLKISKGCDLLKEQIN